MAGSEEGSQIIMSLEFTQFTWEQREEEEEEQEGIE